MTSVVERWNTDVFLCTLLNIFFLIGVSIACAFHINVLVLGWFLGRNFYSTSTRDLIPLICFNKAIWTLVVWTIRWNRNVLNGRDGEDQFASLWITKGKLSTFLFLFTVSSFFILIILSIKIPNISENRTTTWKLLT